MNRPSFLPAAAALLLTALLAGCSGEPSSGDVEQAVKASVEASNQQLNKLGGNLVPAGLKTEVHAVKKVGCAKAEGSAGFNCDVEVDATAPIVGRSKQLQQLRFVKGEEGWQVAR